MESANHQCLPAWERLESIVNLIRWVSFNFPVFSLLFAQKFLVFNVDSSSWPLHNTKRQTITDPINWFPICKLIFRWGKYPDWILNGMLLHIIMTCFLVAHIGVLSYIRSCLSSWLIWWAITLTLSENLVIKEERSKLIHFKGMNAWSKEAYIGNSRILLIDVFVWIIADYYLNAHRRVQITRE